ncbi:MAG: ATP-binding cassette domain-containing protein [Anaerolineae bacterium]
MGPKPGLCSYLVDCTSAQQKVAAIAEKYGLQVDPATKVGQLPVGVRQRVEILKTLYRQAEILILDELTAVLTPQERDGLFKILRGLAAQGKPSPSPTSSTR